jgi:hypothetical protein
VFYPWWQNACADENSSNVQSYHAKVRLDKGESLLVDTGAPKNMTGDAWFHRVSELAKGFGFGSTMVPLKSHISVEGVGAGSSSCTQEGTVPIALSTGEHAHYRAPIVSNSQIPALLGLESLESRRTILDLVPANRTILELHAETQATCCNHGSTMHKFWPMVQV